jgi:hypothetical protein
MKRLRLRRPSPALVLAIIALVVAATGTATAATIVIKKSSQLRTGVVTSRAIANGKNGIKLGDISPGALAGLKGNAGPPGAPGPPGSDAFGSLHYVTSGTLTNTAGAQNFGEAVCSPGERVTGGGVLTSGAFLADQRVNSTYPSDGTGNAVGAPGTVAWAAFVDNHDTVDHSFEVWAVCAKATAVTKAAGEVSKR